MKAQVTKSPEGLPAIELKNPEPQVRDFIRRTLLRNQSDDPVYKLRADAGAFLQCDHETYVLVEFWKPQFQPFVDWLNKNTP